MSFRKFNMAASAAALLSLACLTAARADLVTFASFQQGTGGNNFNFHNNLANGSASQFQTGSSFHVVVGSIPVHFEYQVNNGYNGNSNAVIDATLTMSATVDGTASQKDTGSLGHPAFTDFQDFKNVSLAFTANTPVNGHNNLLTLLSTTEGTFAGPDKGNTGSLFGDTENGYVVDFSSDFLSFSNTSVRDYSLTFTSLKSKLFISPTNGYLGSFTATGEGSFASESAVPDGAGLALLSGGLLPMAGFAFYRRRAARK